MHPRFSSSSSATDPSNLDFIQGKLPFIFISFLCQVLRNVYKDIKDAKLHYFNHLLFQGIHITSLGEVIQLLRAQPTFDFNVLWNEVVVTEHPLKW